MNATEQRMYQRLDKDAAPGSLWARSPEDARLRMVRGKLAHDADAAEYETQLKPLTGRGSFNKVPGGHPDFAGVSEEEE